MNSIVEKNVASPHRQGLPWLKEFALVLVLIAMVAFFSVVSPYFLSWSNFFNILLAVSVIGIMASVSTLVIVGRSLDLSLGSMVALLGVFCGILIENFGWPWYAGVLATVALGAVCGALNGLVIAWLRIDPIITTIATLSIFRGAAFVLTDGQMVLIQDEAVLFLGSGRIFGVPVAVWLLAAVIVLIHLFATRTVAGRSVFAIGANPKAAWVAGLNVPLIRFLIMVASGVSAAIAGILLIGQAGTAAPSAGMGYELLVITAILLGGTGLSGGEGSVFRTAVGVAVIGVLNNGMILLGIPTFYQIGASGVLLLAAVILDRLRHRNGRGIE